MWFWFTCAYGVLGLVASLLYGKRADNIVRRQWGEIGRPLPQDERIHHWWFNFAGSAMGWTVGYWLSYRLAHSQVQVAAADLLLLVFAALGIVGYLPPTLNAVPGLLVHFSKVAEKALEEPLARGESSRAAASR